MIPRRPPMRRGMRRARGVRNRRGRGLDKALPLVGILALTLAALSVTPALTDTNVVAPSKAHDGIVSVAIESFAPAECSHISFDNLISAIGGIAVGTNGNDLIFGSAGADVISALDGDDCIVSGGGDDDLFGGEGADVFDGGLGVDECYGGAGPDTFVDCETEVQ